MPLNFQSCPSPSSRFSIPPWSQAFHPQVLPLDSSSPTGTCSWSIPIIARPLSKPRSSTSPPFNLTTSCPCRKSSKAILIWPHHPSGTVVSHFRALLIFRSTLPPTPAGPTPAGPPPHPNLPLNPPFAKANPFRFLFQAFYLPVSPSVSHSTEFALQGLAAPSKSCGSTLHAQRAPPANLRLPPSLPPSPGQSETEAEADKVVGLIVEKVVDDAVAPSLRVAWIRGRQTRRPQNEVVQGA